MKTFDEQFNDILTRKFLVNKNDINDSSRFLFHFKFDVEELVHFIHDVEVKFKIDIPKQDRIYFLAVGEAKKYIKQRLKLYNGINLN